MLLLETWQREIKCSLARKLFVVSLSISLTSSYIIGLANGELVIVNNNHQYNNNSNNSNASSYYNKSNHSHFNHNTNHNRSGHSYLTYNNNKAYSNNNNNNNRNNNKAPSTMTQACGERLKLEIKSICAAQKSNGMNHHHHSHNHHVPQELQTGNGFRPSILEANTNEIKPRRGSSIESNKLIRVPRGVIDECCRKPCHHHSMLKYCSNFESTRSEPVILEPSITVPGQSLSSSSVEHGNDKNEIKKQGRTNQAARNEPSEIIPLLLQILWSYGESKEKDLLSTNTMNFHPHKVAKTATQRSKHRTDGETGQIISNHHSSRGRSISARDIDQNRKMPRRNSLLTPSSDETRRDEHSSEMSSSTDSQDQDYESSTKKDERSKYDDKRDENRNKSASAPMQTLAVTVTDDWWSTGGSVALPSTSHDYYG